VSGENHSQQDVEVCSQKVTLLNAYRVATAQYSDALANLTRKIGIASRTEYASMYRMVETLRQDAAEFQRELEWHTKQHGC
jgi:hypothetical protein